MVVLSACHSPAEKIVEAKDKLLESRENATEAKNDLEQSEKDASLKAQNDFVIEWGKFKDESEKKINDNDRNLARLKASNAHRHKYMKADYQKAIDNIQRKNENLKSRLADFERNKSESLNAFKRRFNNDINEVVKSLENIK